MTSETVNAQGTRKYNSHQRIMSNLWFYEPFHDFDQIQRTDNNGVIRSLKPMMDLQEDNEKNTITATFEFPGASKDDIQINLHNDRLTVSAETVQSIEHNDSGYAVRERRSGKFSRTLQLPHGVKEEEINAVMDKDILRVTFPKSIPELAPKRISVL